MKTYRYLILTIWILLLLFDVMFHAYWYSAHPDEDVGLILNSLGKCAAMIIPHLTLTITYFFKWKFSNLNETQISSDKLAFYLISLYAVAYVAILVYLSFYTSLTLDKVSDALVQVGSLLSSVFVMIPMANLFEKSEGN